MVENGTSGIVIPMHSWGTAKSTNLRSHLGQTLDFSDSSTISSALATLFEICLGFVDGDYVSG